LRIALGVMPCRDSGLEPLPLSAIERGKPRAGDDVSGGAPLVAPAPPRDGGTMVPVGRVALVAVTAALLGCVKPAVLPFDSGVGDAGSAGGGGGSAPDAGSCGGFGGGSEAYITSDTTAYDFGATTVGGTSATARVNLHIRQTTFTTSVVGKDQAAFTATTIGCFPTSAFSVEYVCPVNVTFQPVGIGQATGTLAFNGTANAGLCLPVTGTGVAPGPLVFAPASVSLDAGTEALLTLTNKGTSASGAIATSITGSAAGFFQVTQDSCAGTALQPSASCQLSVRFVPGTDAGTSAAALVAGTAVAQLQGVAVLPGTISLSTGIHDFGTAAVDGGSGAFDFLVTNISGAAASAISTVSIAGSEFSLTADHCSTVALQPAQSCTVTARFTPHSAGVKTASLTVSNLDTTLYARLVGSAQ
jgi:hypothetical protein